MEDIVREQEERELDGSLTRYEDVPVEGDLVERLLTELFSEHWSQITVGPLVQGAVFEIRFTSAPKVTLLDGYLTVDPGAWHFHLCVNDHRGTPSAELARIRRVARAAFFRTEGGLHGTEEATGTWGLRLWNGRGEQMITILFPSPFYDASWRRLREPDWKKVDLWEACRLRYAGRP